MRGSRPVKKILFMIFSLIAIQVMCVGCDNKDSDSSTNGSGEQESNIYDVAGYEREGIGKILGPRRWKSLCT